MIHIERILRRFPQVAVEESTTSLLLPREGALAIAHYLRHDPDFRLDYCSNVTGVDHLDKVERVKGADGTVTEISKAGYLEAVYHLYSIERMHGPLAVRVRTPDRSDVRLPSLTSVWRSCELQEREAFDLFGIQFEGHPDLRRILMWEGFQDYPMRKDYVEPDDYEYEPTPHDKVLAKARPHFVKGDA